MSPLQNDRYWVAGQNHRDIRQRRVQIMDGHGWYSKISNESNITELLA